MLSNQNQTSYLESHLTSIPDNKWYKPSKYKGSDCLRGKAAKMRTIFINIEDVSKSGCN